MTGLAFAFSCQPFDMVLILDGNQDNVAHACGKIGLFGDKNLICYCSLYNQMP